MKKPCAIDPIPKHFASIEKASDFWDSHDAGDYEEYLRLVYEDIQIENVNEQDELET